MCLRIWARANKIIRRTNREQVSWLCIAGLAVLEERMRKYGKDKFWNCLKRFLIAEMRKFCKDKFWNCLRIFLVAEMRKYGKDKFWNCFVIIFKGDGFDLESWWEWRAKEVRLGEVGKRTEESEWIKWARMGYLYRIMAQSSDRPIGEHLQIAVFALGSFDRREEVRSGGLWGLLAFCG